MNRGYREKLYIDLREKSALRRAVEAGFDYLDNQQIRDVVPGQEALNALSVFDHPLPETGEAGDEIIEKLATIGSNGAIPYGSGRYFGFVNGGMLPVSLAARWLADSWDQNASLEIMSPIAARLESVCEKWLIDLLGLPKNTCAGFVGGSSMATFCGLAAARHHLLMQKGWDVNEQGLWHAPKLRIVTGYHTHATVKKALSLLGLGMACVEWVACDDQGRVRAKDMPELDDSTIVILQAGNVNSGAFDEFEPICRKAREKGAWVHVDGAFGLWAACARPLSRLTNGIELAHSWSADAHKTLNIPYDNGIILCAESDALTSAMALSGSYVLYGEARDSMRYTPDMSRRFRVAELWAGLLSLGRQGVEALIMGFHEATIHMRDKLSEGGFHICNTVVFNQLLVACDDDALTQSTLEHIQNSGEAWAGSAIWCAPQNEANPTHGRRVIRVSVCSWTMDVRQIERAADIFIKARQTALSKL